MMACYRLCQTIANNLLTWDGTVLITSPMDGYDIYFAFIIIYEIHEQTFGELTILPLSFLI